MNSHKLICYTEKIILSLTFSEASIRVTVWFSLVHSSLIAFGCCRKPSVFSEVTKGYL